MLNDKSIDVLLYNAFDVFIFHVNPIAKVVCYICIRAYIQYIYVVAITVNLFVREASTGAV